MTIFRTALTLAGVGLALAAGPAMAQEPAAAEPLPADVEVVEGRALVRFLPGTGAAVRERALEAAGVEVERPMGLDDAYEVRFPERLDPRQVSRVLAAQPGVKWAEPDVYGETIELPADFPKVTPKDPGFPNQWGLDNTGQAFPDPPAVPGKDIDANRAWGITEGEDGPVVAVIDSGVSFTHPDLVNVWKLNPGESAPHLRSNGKDDDGNGYVDDWRGYDTGEDDADPSDTVTTKHVSRGHGMKVAGVIAAAGNDFGLSGVARQGVRLLPVKALKDNGKFTASRVANAIRFAARSGADIANISLKIGVYTHSVNDAIKDSPDLLVIAGSGNEGRDLDWRESYPCETNGPSVICVASHDADGRLSSFTNYGSEVDLAAPGRDIRTTDLDGGYAWASGTSVATPFVSGVAALLYGMNPWLEPADRVGVLTARGAILNSVIPEASMSGRLFAEGRLSAFGALRKLKLKAPSVTAGPADKIDKTWATFSGKIDHRGINITQIGVEYRVQGKPGTLKSYSYERTREALDSTAGGVGETLTSLSPGTTYEYRYIARNPYGTTTSPWKTFTTVKEHQPPSGPGGITNPPKPTH